MKTYILTAELKVTDETIQKARKWEKRKNYRYGESIGSLVLDYLMDSNYDKCEVEKAELDECNETENKFKTLLEEVRNK